MSFLGGLNKVAGEVIHMNEWLAKHPHHRAAKGLSAAIAKSKAVGKGLLPLFSGLALGAAYGGALGWSGHKQHLRQRALEDLEMKQFKKEDKKR